LDIYPITNGDLGLHLSRANALADEGNLSC
jgi:hypothetical protein